MTIILFNHESFPLESFALYGIVNIASIFWYEQQIS